MAVFKHGNEGTFFQEGKIFFRKAWFLAQFHGDSEGQSVVFFKEIPGVFADFQTVYEGVKKIPKIPGHFAFFK